MQTTGTLSTLFKEYTFYCSRIFSSPITYVRALRSTAALRQVWTGFVWSGYGTLHHVLNRVLSRAFCRVVSRVLPVFCPGHYPPPPLGCHILCRILSRTSSRNLSRILCPFSPEICTEFCARFVPHFLHGFVLGSFSWVSPCFVTNFVNVMSVIAHTFTWIWHYNVLKHVVY